MDVLVELEGGRTSFERQAWAEAYSRLSAVDRDSPLPPGDLSLLSMAAYLTGRDAESATLLERAHLGYLRDGETTQAVRCAVERRGVVPSAPGIYFAGLAFQYAFASMLIGGAGRDAQYLAKHIASSRPAPDQSRATAAA